MSVFTGMALLWRAHQPAGFIYTLPCFYFLILFCHRIVSKVLLLGKLAEEETQVCVKSVPPVGISGVLS